MDLLEAIRELRKERHRIDRMIAELEDLLVHGNHAGKLKTGRGRRSMSPEERLRVSERMRNYWAEKKRR